MGFQEPKSARATAPGVKLLKELWDISTEKPAAEPAPENVNTDIYATRVGVPRRARRPANHH
jgi:hypothetical protein